MTYTISTDELYPRDAEHRYRIYARQGASLEILAATGTPGGIGEALVQLDEDEREVGRRLMDRGALGVLDAVESRWIVLPWHRPDGRPSFGRDRIAFAEASAWEGKTVRANSHRRRRQGFGEGLWLVGERGPHGRYRLTPLGASAKAQPISRSADELARNWEIVPQPEGER